MLCANMFDDKDRSLWWRFISELDHFDAKLFRARNIGSTEYCCFI